MPTRTLDMPADLVGAPDPDWTLPKALAAAAARNGRPGAGSRFIRDDGSTRKYPFGELHAEALRRGRNLLDLGLQKGDRVGFVIPDPEDFVLSFLGALCVGVVPVPAYPPLSFGKLDAYLDTTARILRNSGARAVLCGRKVRTILWPLFDTVEGLERIVPVDRITSPVPASAPEPEAIGPDDIAFLQFTSGSTSEPKGVVVTHRSLGANSRAIMGPGLHVDVAHDLAVSWLPLYHDMGLIGFVIAPLYVGLETLFLPTISFLKRPSRWMQAMSDHGGTITFAPNFAFGLAARRTPAAKVAKMDLSRVRLLGAGAERNHPETLREFMAHFAPAGLRPEAMLPVYGMAEATLAMSFSRLDQPLRTDRVDAVTLVAEGRAEPVDEGFEGPVEEIVSCGWAFPDHELVIMDDHGATLPDRTLGEIVLRGPSTAAGYWRNRSKTGETFRRDGLRTGDVGYAVDGEIFVTGRKKDLIILNGRNYDPASIEWAVAEVSDIRKGNVIAFSRPGPQTEELVVVAETRRTDGHEALVDSVRNRVYDELRVHPADVMLLPPGALPKTTSGKLQRSRARAQYIQGALGAEGVRTMGARGDAVKLARHMARSVLSRGRHALRTGLRPGGGNR